MATEVRSWRGGDDALLQLINKERSDDIDVKTRDLLGGSLHKEIDLDVEPPPPLLSFSTSGWEKRLDMKSGKVYFHNANSTQSVQDLNFPPPSPSPSPLRERDVATAKVEWPTRLTDEGVAGITSVEEHDFMGGGGADADADAQLEAEAGSILPLPVEGPEWQSVCTLDKVKMALQRAHKKFIKRKAGEEMLQYQSVHSPPPITPLFSSCSSLVVAFPQHQTEISEEATTVGAISTSLLAAGCPKCLLYVLLPKCDPKCPRCGCLINSTSRTSTSTNSSASAPKRPRLYHIEGHGGSAPNVNAMSMDDSNTTPPPFLFDLNTPT